MIKNINKKNIIDRLNNLNSINNIYEYYKKIFKLIFIKKINYIIKNNGVIFNILDIDDNTINIIDKIMTKYECNQQSLTI